MLFLVDGYNVTMTDPATCSLDKERQRDALTRRLASRGRSLLGTGDIVIVFDAHSQLGVASERTAGLLVVFAPDADTEIVRRCSAAGAQVTVISSDRRLAARISQDVGRFVVYREASSCFEGARGVRKTVTPTVRDSADEQPPASADDITRELERLWLPPDTDKENS